MLFGSRNAKECSISYRAEIAVLPRKVAIETILLPIQIIYFIYTFTGFTTDGEFNSLRASGKNRPVSIIGLIQDARNNARSMRETTMTKYFTLDSKGNKL